MSYLVAHPLRVLACLIAMACGARAEEAKEATSTADQSKVTVGATLMSDYIYRGISYSAHQPSVAAYVDAQQGWLYGYTNFNSVKFSTSPAVEVTVAAGIRPTLGPFEFDIGAAYYYYQGEQGPDLSNYWEAHATLSHKVTDKLSWGPTIAYAPDVWQSGAWGVYGAGTLAYELPSEFLPTGLTWSLSLDFGRWMFGPTSGAGVERARKLGPETRRRWAAGESKCVGRERLTLATPWPMRPAQRAHSLTCAATRSRWGLSISPSTKASSTVLEGQPSATGSSSV